MICYIHLGHLTWSLLRYVMVLGLGHTREIKPKRATLKSSPLCAKQENLPAGPITTSPHGRATSIGKFMKGPRGTRATDLTKHAWVIQALTTYQHHVEVNCMVHPANTAGYLQGTVW